MTDKERDDAIVELVELKKSVAELEKKMQEQQNTANAKQQKANSPQVIDGGSFW